MRRIYLLAGFLINSVFAFAQNIDLLSKYAFGKPIVDRLDLYKQRRQWQLNILEFQLKLIYKD